MGERYDAVDPDVYPDQGHDPEYLDYEAGRADEYVERREVNP